MTTMVFAGRLHNTKDMAPAFFRGEGESANEAGWTGGLAMVLPFVGDTFGDPWLLLSM
jgi:hypothetical protein